MGVKVGMKKSTEVDFGIDHSLWNLMCYNILWVYSLVPNLALIGEEMSTEAPKLENLVNNAIFRGFGAFYRATLCWRGI